MASSPAPEVVREGTSQQYCPDCKTMMTAAYATTWRNCMLVRDVSTCGCGRVLWDWKQGEAFVPKLPDHKPLGQLTLF
jgi:hypothetical protein